MKVYAAQYCTRPSTDQNDIVTEIPLSILGHVNTVIDSIRQDMSTVLAEECEQMDGTWNPTFDENELENKHTHFYNTTNANPEWGLCISSE